MRRSPWNLSPSFSARDFFLSVFLRVFLITFLFALWSLVEISLCLLLFFLRSTFPLLFLLSRSASGRPLLGRVYTWITRKGKAIFPLRCVVNEDRSRLPRRTKRTLIEQDVAFLLLLPFTLSSYFFSHWPSHCVRKRTAFSSYLSKLKKMKVR